MNIIKLILKESDLLVGTFTYGEDYKNWNFKYSPEYLKTDLPLLWEFPNLDNNYSEYMPQVLRIRFPGGKKVPSLKKDELARLKKYGNRKQSQYKIEFDEI